MKKIGVYLGANYGNNTSFQESAIQLAHEIVRHNLILVYGGSSLGMMGLLARTVKNLNGQVIGTTTKFLLEQEDPFFDLDELYVVNTMQERKKCYNLFQIFFL